MTHLSFHFPSKSLLTICKSFVRPHLDYTDIISDNPETKPQFEKV